MRAAARRSPTPWNTRLDGLVAELLAMTQRREPYPVSLELQPFLAERVRLCGEAAARNIAVTIEATTSRAVIDPDMTGRILDNLLSNAIRHMPAGGRWSSRRNHRTRGFVLALSIRGLVLRPNLRDRVFEPFVFGRADGTGLGLAIARELAGAQGRAAEPASARRRSAGRAAEFALDCPEGCHGNDPDRR